MCCIWCLTVNVRFAKMNWSEPNSVNMISCPQKHCPGICIWETEQKCSVLQIATKGMEACSRLDSADRNGSWRAGRIISRNGTPLCNGTPLWLQIKLYLTPEYSRDNQLMIDSLYLQLCAFQFSPCQSVTIIIWQSVDINQAGHNGPARDGVSQ